MKVKCVKHVDIRGKEQLYIIVGEEKAVIINVGEKTFYGIKMLTEVKEVPQVPEVMNEGKEKEVKNGK